MTEYDEYLEFAKQLAYDAGLVMRKYFGQKPKVEWKTSEIVTVADKEINSLVIERVLASYPDHAIDGEEESYGSNAKYVWVCDPIDGTNPFAMELPISVFSLALVVDGDPVVGVIYEPQTDKLYSATKGSGAFLNDQPTQVSTETFGERAIRMNYDYWPAAGFDIMPAIRQLAQEKNVYFLSPGSTTHMAALVSRGELAASIFPGTSGKNVDIAAAKVIIEEAGGRVTDMFGNEQRYDRPINGAIVSNGLVHDEIVRYLKQHITEKS